MLGLATVVTEVQCLGVVPLKAARAALEAGCLPAWPKSMVQEALLWWKTVL